MCFDDVFNRLGVVPPTFLDKFKLIIVISNKDVQEIQVRYRHGIEIVSRTEIRNKSVETESRTGSESESKVEPGVKSKEGTTSGSWWRERSVDIND
ncbi:hypothetical protein EVAR_4264_1 [Eumeta japonica]|uniref:Uncharacterized protein n=1 Tax=Eumeta variegata TaxID=151549 RepID=A0A4C1Z7V9_EUMVA|nr:hypothetical protein EVAR_4264_1 [Eumeta japonica]